MNSKAMIPEALDTVHDKARFGGKAVQLGEALRAGLPVPTGVALSVEMVDAIAAGDQAARGAAGALLVTLGPSLAIRSSAVGEDSSAASFAGLHVTILNVISATELASAIVRVWESGRSEAALAYRKRRSVEGAPRIAVVVQRMVRADRAGVMFTRDPVSGRDERVIEAGWGLGEAIVSGVITPDLYRLDRAGVVIERRPGMKDRMIAFVASGGGTHEIAVEPERHRALCLEDPCLAQLFALAQRCDHVFGTTHAHDVEWAFEGSVLHLLQRRPITTTR